MSSMTEPRLPMGIEVYELANRRLYAKTSGGAFALFEDDLTPEELIAIAEDIAKRRPDSGPQALQDSQAA